MAGVDFRCDSADKVAMLFNEDNDYYVAHNADDADGTQTGTVYIGQDYTGGIKYSVFRGMFCFDTSGLDDDCLIISATLRFYQYAAGQTINVIVKSGKPTYPHMPAVVGDYDLDHYSGNGGEATIGGNGSITLNFDGRGWINKTGNTKLAVLAKNDVDGAAPTTGEAIYVYGYQDGMYVGQRPKLTVVYATPTGSPAVGNASYSGTKDTHTLATANVTDDGGGYEERGFEYGPSEEPTWAMRETGVFTGTGNFSLTISGLRPSTTYYGRAFTTNSFGTTYSDGWTSFTTTASPSYGLYEEDNTATISFYISEDDGMTWGQKHGPYTSDQADIEITKLLVRGSGKKKIKFESDVLTGISASVMVKLDLKAR